MITEIFIENRRVDINADISSLLTFAIDDVKNFASRQTAFSKTIVLPGTARNNAVFGNIFDTGNANEYDSTQDNIGYNFNAAKSARVLVFQDNIQTFKGTVRLLEITKDRGRIEYEVALNGELTGLNVALSSSKLEDLDFSAYDQAFTAANITASWDAAPGSGVYFPLIDHGGYSAAKHDWDVLTFRPALYVKEYIDKMFEAADYRYSCDLFETARFKRLIIPHNQKLLQTLNTRLLNASRNSSAQVINSGTASELALPFSSFEGSLFTDSVGMSRFTYTGATTVNLTFFLQVFGQYTSPDIGYNLSIRKNGVILSGSEKTLAVTGDTTTRYYGWNADVTTSLVTGDYIEVYYEATASSGISGNWISATNVVLYLDSTIAVPTPLTYGDAINMNYSIPKNIRQVDFLVSIVKLFNLYIYEDQFDERKMLIAPFIDFYSLSSGYSVDWTYKLNRDKPIQIKPMSELNSKIYDFDYKDDSDYFNDLYKKRYNKTYGSNTYDSEFEFATQRDKVELIFAPTPLVGYEAEDKVYSTIFKKTNDVEEPIDSVIRILQTKKIEGVTSWDLLDDVTILASLTDYGYAGHFDDPDNPDNDLNFGVCEELFFVLVTGDISKTQFNLYWSSYMAEITDKDSKLLVGKFYLTPKDIFDLDFSKYVIVDGVLFRLNKIIDYNATIPGDCTVELLKVINTSYSFPQIEGGSDMFLLWNDISPLMDLDTQEVLYG